MTDYSTLFKYPAEQAGSERIIEIERFLGRTLPEDYKRLLSQTGGGTLDSKNCYLDNFSLPNGDKLEIAVDDIFGNGKTVNDSNVDLIEYATFLMEEWEIPEEVLLFATSEDGMHQCFVINYDFPNYPQGAVLYLDTDPDGIMEPVAESVDAFLSKLGPYPSDTETLEEVTQDGVGIRGVRYGSLSDSLTDAIGRTPTPDIEKLLRKVTEPITNELSPAITGDTKESRRFLDVAYWLVQHVEPQYDPETYALGGREGQKVVLLEMMGNSFKVPGQEHGLGFILAAIIEWWDRRVEEGDLKETPDGFVLDEEYIAGVLERIREEEL